MSDRDVDISGLDKAEVLLALHRGAHAVGPGAAAWVIAALRLEKEPR